MDVSEACQRFSSQNFSLTIHFLLILSTFSGSNGVGKDDGVEDEPINIFSLASGHLYERFLRIMMLSVIKHTKSPVKFWFLKNYLSPSFKVRMYSIRFFYYGLKLG